MFRPMRPHFRIHVSIVVTATLFMQGCLSWRPVPINEGQTANITTGFIRVHTRAGEEIVLQKPFTRGDSIGGISTYPVTASRMFALSDLTSVELGAVDSRKMALIGAGAVALVGAAALLFLWAISNSSVPYILAPMQQQTIPDGLR